MEGIRVNAALTIPDHEIVTRFTPSGGPGGQHANRSNTRVEMTWDIASSSSIDDRMRERLVAKLGDAVRVVVDDERSQHRNRDLARDRLRVRVSSALYRPPQRRATKPTRGSKRRRVEGKRQRSQLKAQRRRPRHDD